jgi:hypothetical protein
VIIGASSVQQLDNNLAALDFEIPVDARRRLDRASTPAISGLYSMFTPEYQSWVVSPGLGRRQADDIRAAGVQRRRHHSRLIRRLAFRVGVCRRAIGRPTT